MLFYATHPQVEVVELSCRTQQGVGPPGLPDAGLAGNELAERFVEAPEAVGSRRHLARDLSHAFLDRGKIEFLAAHRVLSPGSSGGSPRWRSTRSVRCSTSLNWMPWPTTEW